MQPALLRRLTEEVAALRLRIAANPRDAMLRVRLAELLEKCADDAGSIQEYRNAGSLFMKQGQFRKARAIYQLILHRLPMDDPARRGFDAAEEECLASVPTPTDDPQTRLALPDTEERPAVQLGATPVNPSDAETVPPPARSDSGHIELRTDELEPETRSPRSMVERTHEEPFPVPPTVAPEDPVREDELSVEVEETPNVTASVIRFAESDRRATPRVPWMVDVDVFVGTERFSGRCRDLSMNGLYVAGPFLNAGQEVQLSFHVPGGDWVAMGAGKVTRCGARGEESGVGIRLESVDNQTREHMITRIARALGYSHGQEGAR